MSLDSMAKTHRPNNIDEIPKEAESPAHKKRRKEHQKLQDVLRAPSYEEFEDEEFETFEPIRRKNGRER